MRTSPLRSTDAISYVKGYPVVGLSNTENVSVVPFLLNCKRENRNMICSDVPQNVQQKAVFVVDASTLKDPSDILCDSNGVWNQTKTRASFYVPIRDKTDNVTSVIKEDKLLKQVEFTVIRRTYMNASYTNFKRTIVTIENSGKKGELFCSCILVIYSIVREEEEKPFTIKPHGNVKGTRPFIRVKPSARQDLRNLAEANQEKSTEKTKKLFNDNAGGFLKAQDLQELAITKRQVQYEKAKIQPLTVSDPLSEIAGLLNVEDKDWNTFIRHVNMSDETGYYVLYTDNMMKRLIDACGTDKIGYKQPVACDVKFNVGPFFVFSVSFKWPVLQSISNNLQSPLFPGIMVIMHTLSLDTYSNAWGV